MQLLMQDWSSGENLVSIPIQGYLWMQRNVQVSFDHVVTMDGLQLAGTVMTHKQFRFNFDPSQQLSLFN
jgi:hypothetical protein